MHLDPALVENEFQRAERAPVRPRLVGIVLQPTVQSRPGSCDIQVEACQEAKRTDAPVIAPERERVGTVQHAVTSARGFLQQPRNPECRHAPAIISEKQ